MTLVFVFAVVSFRDGKGIDFFPAPARASGFASPRRRSLRAPSFGVSPSAPDLSFSAVLPPLDRSPPCFFFPPPFSFSSRPPTVGGGFEPETPGPPPCVRRSLVWRRGRSFFACPFSPLPRFFFDAPAPVVTRHAPLCAARKVNSALCFKGSAPPFFRTAFAFASSRFSRSVSALRVVFLGAPIAATKLRNSASVSAVACSGSFLPRFFCGGVF
mmetsp:Transcript_9915/g.36847  ORF Transcript_9915/g.36847 Transcript_9915/m.36847 type:complete len:214 (+) Transcript_9915:2184-2825(+)